MSRRLPLLACLFALAAGPALAHAGHGPENGLAAGFLHPFTGLDHLLAMAAVGLWTGLVQPVRSWAVWPSAFLAFTLAGFAAGLGGAATPVVEGLIIASVVGLGLAVAFRVKASTAVGCAVIALFALAHGCAHGQEAPAGAPGFVAGFALATLSLHLTGLGLAALVRRLRVEPVARAAGLGIAASGLALIWLG